MKPISPPEILPKEFSAADLRYSLNVTTGRVHQLEQAGIIVRTAWGSMRATRFEINPNAVQRLYFDRACGTARFAWNWALSEWRKQYAAGGKPSEMSLRRQFNAIKRAQYPWVYDVSKCVVQEAIIDLGTAFRAFFEKRGRYPQFKCKGDRASPERTRSGVGGV